MEIQKDSFDFPHIESFFSIEIFLNKCRNLLIIKTIVHSKGNRI